MNFSTFFSKQARRPWGVFGRLIMGFVFDRGNAFLNDFACELMSVQKDDHVIEIGFGTGKLIHDLARKVDNGLIEGIDFSGTMVAVAHKRNRKNIEKGRVKLVEGDFDKMTYERGIFSKACSVNTLYFWPDPLHTARKIAEILNPAGICILAFEDIEQLKRRKLNRDVFTLYSKDEVKDLLANAGFSNGIDVVSKKRGELIFHCAVAKK